MILHVAPDFARVQESVLFTHSHNSLLNLLAETGLLGAGIVVAGLLWIYAALLWRWRDPVVLAATAMVTVSLLHSLVEYPLWYYHLFGPFALMLVFLRDDGVQLPLPLRGQVVCLCSQCRRLADGGRGGGRCISRFTRYWNRRRMKKSTRPISRFWIACGETPCSISRVTLPCPTTLSPATRICPGSSRSCAR